ADVARGLEVSPFIRLGRGEFASGGAERDSILADVTEAIFGAIYLDSSFDKVFEIIKVIFQEAVRQVEPFDPKTDLQERLHVLGYPAPEYVLEAVEGPEHAPTFITMVNIKGEFAGRGQGATKKASQQQAAAVAIQKLILQEKEEKEKKVEEIVVEVAEPKE
ncbi:MAG: ribonuclease III, partial [Proteobacteria bacterium]|nr:ribonuclease III [Pseudomonadota bacterium]